MVADRSARGVSDEVLKSGCTTRESGISRSHTSPSSCPPIRVSRSVTYSAEPGSVLEERAGALAAWALTRARLAVAESEAEAGAWSASSQLSPPFAQSAERAAQGERSSSLAGGVEHPQWVIVPRIGVPRGLVRAPLRAGTRSSDRELP